MTLIGSNHLPLLEEGTVTVTTSGVPVNLSSIKGKKAVIQSLSENNDAIIVIGESSTVDGAATPPVGRHLLYATQTLTEKSNDTSKIYIDSNVNGAKVRFSIFG